MPQSNDVMKEISTNNFGNLFIKRSSRQETSENDVIPRQRSEMETEMLLRYSNMQNQTVSDKLNFNQEVMSDHTDKYFDQIKVADHTGKNSDRIEERHNTEKTSSTPLISQESIESNDYSKENMINKNNGLDNAQKMTKNEVDNGKERVTLMPPPYLKNIAIEEEVTETESSEVEIEPDTMCELDAEDNNMEEEEEDKEEKEESEVPSGPISIIKVALVVVAAMIITVAARQLISGH